MGRLKVGDNIKLSKAGIEFNLSHEGMYSYTVVGEIRTEAQQKALDNMVIATMLSLMCDDVVGEVLKVNRPNTELENYRVKILKHESNYDRESLILVKETK